MSVNRLVYNESKSTIGTVCFGDRKRKVETIMAKVYWKGSTLLAPVSPTMVTCGSWEKPNIITIAWTGIVNSQPPMTYISVRPSRYSYELLKETGEFVINLTPAQLVRQADWCGVRSGRDEDKFAPAI